MTGDGMKRSVGLALLMAVVCPLVLAAQGVPTAPAALPVDSLLKAANAAAAANPHCMNITRNPCTRGHTKLMTTVFPAAATVAAFSSEPERQLTPLNSSHPAIS